MLYYSGSGEQKSPLPSPTSFNLLDTLVETFKAKVSAIPKLLNLNQDRLTKKWLFFWSYPYKVEVMIMSLIEMLELSNFGHMGIFTI